jgi:hypothetical protein
MATLSDRIKAKGLDEAHELSLLRRRARYAQKIDRAKFFPSSTYVPSSYMYNKPQPVIDRDVFSLRNQASIADYVSAWTRLNHLKEA